MEINKFIVAALCGLLISLCLIVGFISMVEYLTLPPDGLMVYADRARHGSPAHLTFKVFGRWRYDIVLFIDHGLDGDLDEVKYSEYGDAEEQTVLPDDSSWGEWKERYLKVRKEAIEQPSE